MVDAPVVFRLFGEVEVRFGEQTFDVGHARQRCVLAVLLMDAGRALPVDLLIDRVWGDRPPKRAREVLYTSFLDCGACCRPAVSAWTVVRRDTS